MSHPPLSQDAPDPVPYLARDGVQVSVLFDGLQLLARPLSHDRACPVHADALKEAELIFGTVDQQVIARTVGALPDLLDAGHDVEPHQQLRDAIDKLTAG